MGTVDQTAYEAATRALWHHRHRAADALVASVATALTCATVDHPEWLEAVYSDRTESVTGRERVEPGAFRL